MHSCFKKLTVGLNTEKKLILNITCEIKQMAINNINNNTKNILNNILNFKQNRGEYLEEVSMIFVPPLVRVPKN